MENIINFISNIDNSTYNKIRHSKSDAECRRYLKEQLTKQLPINGVVTGLLCVDDANCDYITLGDTYKLIEESETLYTILDNDGDEIKYDKNNFTKIYK